MTTEERIAKLEAQIERLEEKETGLRKKLVDAQLDQWYGRIEDLGVQAHLGAMDAGDRATGLMEQLRSRWSDVKSQVEGATSTGPDVIDSVRDAIEGLLGDVREALVEAKDKAKT